MKAVVFTLGCKLNQYESSSVITGLKELGWEVSSELGAADLYIINTCAVTGEAEKKSRQAIARVRRYSPSARIIVTGCAAEKEPATFFNKEGVELVTGTGNKDKIIELIGQKGIFIDDKDEYFEKYLPDTSSRARTQIKIQDGCDNFCSYCIIPYLRGRSRSRDPEKVLSEIETLHPAEVILTGVDISSYKYGNIGLGGLLLKLAGCDARIRLGSVEVGVIDKEFLDATKALRDFAPHFHLSLQSGSDRTLRFMNRKYTSEEFMKKVELIRSYYPNAGITTDVIAGFPSENISDFEDSISFVEDVAFSDIHCFPYSRREGTVAAGMEDLPPEIKRERLERLLQLKQKLKSAFIDRNEGSVEEIVAEETVDGMVVGYTGNYIKVYVDSEPTEEKFSVKIKEKFKDGAIAAKI